MAEVGLTNYEINQQAYLSCEPMKEENLDLVLANVGAWFSSFKNLDYVGLLCRERNDYTIVHINNYNFSGAVQEIKEILESRGEIMDILYTHGADNYQCWVRERRTDSIDVLLDNVNYEWQPQVWMFVLFNADGLVVETE